MTMIQSNAAKGIDPIPYPSGSNVVAKRYSVALTTGQLVADNIVEMAPIPPNANVVDVILDSDDLDSDATPAITLDVGVMSGAWGSTAAGRTCGAEFFSGSTVAQAGGIARPTLKTAQRVAASSEARSIGIKIATAPDVAVAGTVGLTVFLSGA